MRDTFGWALGVLIICVAAGLIIAGGVISAINAGNKPIAKKRLDDCSAIALRVVTRTGQAAIGNVVFRECLLQKSV